MQFAGKALVLGFGPKAGHAATLVVGIELELQADRILDAAHETHAEVGLLFHDAASLRLSHYSIDAGFGQRSTARSWHRPEAVDGRATAGVSTGCHREIDSQ